MFIICTEKVLLIFFYPTTILSETELFLTVHSFFHLKVNNAQILKYKINRLIERVKLKSIKSYLFFYKRFDFLHIIGFL